MVILKGWQTKLGFLQSREGGVITLYTNSGDNGGDVSSYYDIDPLMGTQWDDFKTTLVAASQT